MRIRKRERIRSSKTTDVFFASIMGGLVVSVGFGLPAGILAAVAGFACGFPVARREEKEEASSLIHHEVLEDELFEALKKGRGVVRVETKLKNIHPNKPLLGRLIFGDNLKKETTYYLDD